MTLREARTILLEMNKWRRGEPPYDGETPEEHRDMPYTPEQFGKAIEIGVYAIDEWIETSPHA